MMASFAPYLASLTTISSEGRKKQQKEIPKVLVGTRGLSGEEEEELRVGK